MLGLAICWIAANLFREARFEADAYRTYLAARNSPILLLAILGALIWTAATWQRLYSIAGSDWAATCCTFALASLWGYLFSFRMWPILALGLILVGPIALGIPRGDLSRHEKGREINEKTSVW
jgi:hypothetical protein